MRYFILAAPKDSKERVREGFSVFLRGSNPEALKVLAKDNLEDKFWIIVKEVSER